MHYGIALANNEIEFEKLFQSVPLVSIVLFLCTNTVIELESTAGEGDTAASCPKSVCADASKIGFALDKVEGAEKYQ